MTYCLSWFNGAALPGDPRLTTVLYSRGRFLCTEQLLGVPYCMRACTLGQLNRFTFPICTKHTMPFMSGVMHIWVSPTGLTSLSRIARPCPRGTARKGIKRHSWTPLLRAMFPNKGLIVSFGNRHVPVKTRMCASRPVLNIQCSAVRHTIADLIFSSSLFARSDRLDPHARIQTRTCIDSSRNASALPFPFILGEMHLLFSASDSTLQYKEGY